VGVVVDAHGPVDVTRVTVITDTPGFTAEIRATNLLGTARAVSDKKTVRRRTAFDIDADAPKRYWIVWITKLPPDRNYAHVNEVRAFGS
jgi:hypothetical protein